MKSLFFQSKQDVGNRNPSVAKRLFSSVGRDLEGLLKVSSRAAISTLTVASALLLVRCSESTLVGVSPPDANVGASQDTTERTAAADVSQAEVTKNDTKSVPPDSVSSPDILVPIDTIDARDGYVDVPPIVPKPDTVDTADGKVDSKGDTVISVDASQAEITKNKDVTEKDSNISSPDVSVFTDSAEKPIDTSQYMYSLDLESPDSAFFPLSGQDINFVYYPIPNPDFSDGLEQLDAKLTIIPMKNKVYPNQDLGYTQELSEDNILPYSPNKFVFNVPTEGVYRWLLSYTLHYADGTSKVYPDYTPEKIEEFKKGKKGPAPLFGYHFLVVPHPDAQPLSEIIAGQNDSADKDRFNIVFMHTDGTYNQWDDADPNDQTMLMKGITDMITGKFGPFSVEPLKSNQNKFNFWYYAGDVTFAKVVETYELVWEDYGLNDLSNYQKLMQGISLPNQIIVRVEANYYSGGKLCAACASAGGIIIYFPKGDIQECQKTHSLDSCIAEQKVSRILTHELGHKIARLPEEYEDDKSIENPDEELKGDGQKYPYNLGPGGDTTIFTGKIMEEDCIQPDTDTGGETCTPNQGAIDFCLQHARWRDLIGNGCGEDGIIDCDADDPLFRAEVSCNYAGAGWPKAYLSAHTTKSTKVSIMDWSGKFFNIMLFGSEFYEGYTKDVKDYELYEGRFYGQVNERQLCRYIMLLTGSVGGICSTLCLDGCKGEQKCVEGECMEEGLLK